MSAPITYPCSNWAESTNLCSPCDDYSLDSALLDDFLDMASQVLYELSAKQFPGTCTETIRPCSDPRYPTSPFSKPIYYQGHWQLPLGGGCGCGHPDRCSCSRLRQIKLPRYPITNIDEVKIDGVVLATTAYRVDEHQYLVSLDSDNRFPCCQDLELADTEEGTFSVTYDWGRDPPAMGVRAAATLACELYLACQPEDAETACRLPRNIASLARQGVTMAFQLVDELFSPRNGKPVSFGIPEIDIFLATYNPHGKTAPSVVMSPDTHPLGRRVGT